MSQTQIASNPFGLMLDPDAVLKAIACSEHLACLKRRIYRPLDKPMIGKIDGGSAGAASLDDETDD